MAFVIIYILEKYHVVGSDGFKVSLMVRGTVLFSRNGQESLQLLWKERKSLNVYSAPLTGLKNWRWALHHQSCDDAARLARTFSNSSRLRRFSVMLLLSSNLGRMTAMYPSVDGCADESSLEERFRRGLCYRRTAGGRSRSAGPRTLKRWVDAVTFCSTREGVSKIASLTSRRRPRMQLKRRSIQLFAWTE